MAFDTQYASLYDVFYHDVDYAAHVAILRKHIDSFFNTRCSVLDVGCGTGRHLKLLKEMYDVRGGDISDGMLAAAKILNPDVQFDLIDASSFDLHTRFDVVTMNSAVLSYQTSNQSLMSAFGSVKRHLKPNGLFIFDVWHGPAVLSIGVDERLKIVESKGLHVTRRVRPSLDKMNSVVTCDYTWDCGVADETRPVGFKYFDGRETHVARYFFPKEIELICSILGFSLIGVWRADNDEEFKTGDECWHARYVLLLNQ